MISTLLAYAQLALNLHGNVVLVARVRSGRAWASGPIPAVLDGEPTTLGPVVDFRFRPIAFRALVPRELEPSA